jgi:histidyl-tRNA synthetase
MEAQGVTVELTGPDFFIIDSTREKTAALSLARRLRDCGASVARDIVTRGLEDSLAYARSQRVARALIVGSPGTETGEMLVLDLQTGAQERLAIRAALQDPETLLAGVRGVRHA